MLPRTSLSAAMVDPPPRDRSTWWSGLQPQASSSEPGLLPWTGPGGYAATSCGCALHGRPARADDGVVEDLLRQAYRLSGVCAWVVPVGLLLLLVVLLR